MHAPRPTESTGRMHVVLHLVTSASASIAQARMVMALAGGLKERYELHCCFVDGRGPLREELEAAGVPTYDLGGENLHRLRASFSLYRLLRNMRPAILHDHYGGPISRAVAWFAGVPSILLHAHSQIPTQQRWSPWSRSSIFADHVIASSQAVASCMRAKSIIVAYPGLNLRTKARGIESTNVIGTVGRLSEEKGTQYLIRAMGFLRERIPELRLVVVGAGPQKAELEALVVALDLKSRVEFVGWQHDILSYLDSWDLFILPSLQEGFGVAAVEAMSSGLPVIASRVGGLEEVIIDGKTGWLVEPGNPEALSRQIHFVLGNHFERHQVAEAGRQFAIKHFSTETMVRKLRALYELCDEVQ
jgi:glycosyltransferase involved in cell wall biosynthesis